MSDTGMMEKEYKSKKTNSKFIVRGRKERAFLVVTGEAATNPKVAREVARIQTGGGTFSMVEWVARQFSLTY